MRRLFWMAMVVAASAWVAGAAMAQDGGTEDAAQPPCSADSLEPNDSFDAAHALTVPGTWNDLTGCADDDWYSFSVNTGDGLIISIDFLDDDADLDLYVYDAAATDTELHSSAGVTDGERIIVPSFESAMNLLVKVRNFSRASSWAAYDMAVEVYPGGYDPCAADDAREENDDYSTASALTGAGTVADLFGCDDDWYSVTVPANNGVTVDLTFSHADSNLNLFLYDAAATATALHSSTSSSDNESAFVGRFEQQTQMLILVRNAGASYYRTAAYTMDVAFHAGGFCGEPCATDDSYEPNNNASCGADISAQVPGTVSGLTGCDEEDWYAFTGPADTCIGVEIAFTNADSDLDLYIFDAADTSDYLDSSAGYEDTEHVDVDGLAAATPLLVRVRNYGFSQGNQSAYTLTVTTAAGTCAPPVPDAGTPDTAPRDTSTGTDTASGVDSASGTDAGSSSGSDAASGDGDGDGDDGGCMCTARGSRGAGLALLAAIGLALFEMRRRRRG